jgi:hypothetical protein
MATMKTRVSWLKVGKYIGVGGLVCGLLFLAVFHGAEQRVQQTSKRPSLVAAQTKETPKWIDAYGKLPLSFEENQGQTAREVRYVSHGGGYELFLTPQEAVLALRSSVPRDLSPFHRTATLRALRKERRAGQWTAVRMRLEGANPEEQISGMDQLLGKTNYFIGNDPKKWHTDVPSYSRVKYAGVYPGVDLVFYGNQRRLEYDFVVAPGADPKAIALDIDGARRMHINSHGDLVLSVANGEVELQKPLVYQNLNGQRREIAGGYTLAGDHRVKFTVGSYDRSKPLILDPVLNYSTYLGGGAADVGLAIAVDGSGNAFIAGQTLSTNFPAGVKGDGVAGPATNSGASFVAEINPAGTQLLYSGYLSGTVTNINEQAFGVAVDSTGKVYVTGQTYATDFPTTANGLKTGTNAGNINGTSYITKLDPTVNGSGSLLYSSYLGGTNGTQTVGDIGASIAVDTNGIAYVAGYTDSTPSTTVTSLPNFPLMNGFQTTLNAVTGNAFLAKIDTTKSGAASLLYSTYLGGTAANAANFLLFGDEAFGVAIDAASGNAYLAGVTSSTDFPTNGTVTAFQAISPAGNTQGTAFVTQIDTTKAPSTQLIYSTYLGGVVFDEALAIALGPNKVAYVTGTTSSNNFPTTTGAFDTSGAASGKAFVSLVDTSKSGATTLKYSTFLGGSHGNTGFGIQVDTANNAYVAGTTNGSVGIDDFPFPPKASIIGGFEPTFPAGAVNTGFIAKLNPVGGGSNDLLYSTYFGGSGTATKGDQIFAIAIDASTTPNIFVTGQTFSTAATFPVFPTTAPTAFQTALNGPSDAFVAKLTPISTVAVSPTSLAFGTVLVGTTSPAQMVTLMNNTNAAIAFTSAVVDNGNPPATPPIVSTDYAATNTCASSIAAGASCTVSLTFKPLTAGSKPATLTLTDGDSTSPQNIALTGIGANPTPAVGLAPTTLTFTSQLLNTPSAAQTVTLTNTGTGPLTISSITVTGTNAGDFAETSTGATACPITPPATPLAAGANCTISVTFTPTATGIRTGTLTITDNATPTTQTVGLTGTGTNTPPNFTLSASPTTFSVAQGAVAAPVTITVNPTGGFNSPVALTCTGAPAKSSCVLNPTTITPPATTSTLSFTAHAMIVPVPVSKRVPPINMIRIVPLFVALMLLFLMRSTQRLRTRLSLVSAICICVTLSACSGSGAPSNSTAKGTYTLTVTGTSGALAPQTATVTVTVQ